ncbi:hypothetical protein ACWDOP_20475 [Nocardia sp. NPDC003693]
MSRTTEQQRVSAYRFPEGAHPASRTAPQRSPLAEHPLELRVTSGFQRTPEQWTVPKQLVAHCTSGRVVIDFTRAHCTRREIDLELHAGSGTIVIVVPRGWRVDLDGLRRGADATVADRVNLPRFPGAPLIRVVGQIETGVVKARYAYRSPMEWLRRSR